MATKLVLVPQLTAATPRTVHFQLSSNLHTTSRELIAASWSRGNKLTLANWKDKQGFVLLNNCSVFMFFLLCFIYWCIQIKENIQTIAPHEFWLHRAIPRSSSDMQHMHHAPSHTDSTLLQTRYVLAWRSHRLWAHAWLSTTWTSKVAQFFFWKITFFFWHNAKLLISQSTTGLDRCLTEHSLRHLPMDKDLHWLSSISSSSSESVDRPTSQIH